jgi:acetyl-CoA C-acetyltransferase
MTRFNQDIFIAAGLRTPFGRGGGALAGYDAISLSVPVVKAMAEQVAEKRPDLVLWGTVIPNLGWSNIAREIWSDAKLDPRVPSFSVVLACATSITASFAAAGMIGSSIDVVLVGGSETMSRGQIALTPATSDRLRNLFAKDPPAAAAALGSLTPADFILPAKGWANRITGRTMGDHMEQTAKEWGITREAQDEWSYQSHRRAVAGWESGFFDDRVIPLPELEKDANPRADTSLEKLASLPPAFDRTSGLGTLTAGNSSPITDGAAGLWVVSAAGRRRLKDGIPAAKLVDYELAAVDIETEGLLMATTDAIPRLLDRHASPTPTSHSGRSTRRSRRSCSPTSPRSSRRAGSPSTRASPGTSVPSHGTGSTRTAAPWRSAIRSVRPAPAISARPSRNWRRCRRARRRSSASAPMGAKVPWRCLKTSTAR